MKKKIEFNFQAAIFDLDGTLLDSLDVWKQIDVKFLSKRGLAVPSYYLAEVCAKSFEEAAKYTIDLFGFSESVEAVMKEWNDMAAYKYAHKVQLLPYTADYLKKLKKAGIRLAVATGSQDNIYIPCLKRNGIYDLFEVCCSVDEVGKGKSQPDIFFHTAKKLNLLPEQCILFDDVLAAVRSGKKAGMTVCGVYDKYSAQDREEIEMIADGYIMDFREAPLPKEID